MATASDLRYYALPDLNKRLEQLVAQKAEDDARGGMAADNVTPEQVAEIVARWTNIPVTKLMSTEKQKLLKMDLSDEEWAHVDGLTQLLEVCGMHC